MTTPAQARVDRRDEVRIQLRNAEIGLETFVALCWEATEIEFIDLYRFIGGIASKMPQKLERGFNPAEVEQLLLSFGAGRYRLSPYWGPNRQYVNSRVWSVGSFTDEPAAAQAHPAGDRNGTGLDVAAMSKTFEHELKGMGMLEQWKDFILQRQASAEARADAREMKPIEMFIMALNTLKPAGPTGPDPEVAALRAEVAAMQRQQLDALQRKIEALETARAPAAGAEPSDLKTQIASVITVAAQLGLTKAERGAGQSAWTPGAVKEIVESATPVLQPFINTMDKLIQYKLGVLEPSQPVLPEGTVIMPAKNLPPQLQEMIALTLSALKEKQFDDVYHMLDQVMVRPDGSPLVLVNPKVSVVVYAAQLRQLIPEIDQYRAELGEFLRWVEGKRIEDHAAQVQTSAKPPGLA